MANTAFTPRFIRMRDAPAYVGMAEETFNRDVRPFLIEVPIGKRGRAFDRLDLDRFIDDYKRQNAIDKSALTLQSQPRGERRGDKSWRKNQSQDCSYAAASGTSTSKSMASDFAKVVELAKRRKLKGT